MKLKLASMLTIPHSFWTARKKLSSALNMLDDFSRISGLRLNDKKTEALWIGSSIGNEKFILPGKDFKWSKYKAKTLGLWLSVKPEFICTAKL